MLNGMDICAGSGIGSAVFRAIGLRRPSASTPYGRVYPRALPVF